MVLNFYNKIKERPPVSKEKVKKILAMTAYELKIEKNFELSVLLVGPREIKDLNKKYRQRDKVTDVLSFSQKEGEKMKLPQEAENYLGDIVICLAQAKKQSKNFNFTFAEEFSLLLIHGFLHLNGYDDETLKGCRRMEKIQNKVLSRIYG
ncbi:MAG: rRNA maturation RNase YbeY [Patescibacteria group bacterium]|nr:rRNA maturation RNase YbeY [Patescibacteria group bacterium]